MDYSPWGHKELDTTEGQTLSLFTFVAGEDSSRFLKLFRGEHNFFRI